MYNTAIIVVLFIIVGNIFTIFVFWKNRNRLRRTFFLLINLAVTDLFVGFRELIASGPFDIAGILKKQALTVLAMQIFQPLFKSLFLLRQYFSGVSKTKTSKTKTLRP